MNLIPTATPQSPFTTIDLPIVPAHGLTVNVIDVAIPAADDYWTGYYKKPFGHGYYYCYPEPVGDRPAEDVANDLWQEFPSAALTHLETRFWREPGHEDVLCVESDTTAMERTSSKKMTTTKVRLFRAEAARRQFREQQQTELEYVQAFIDAIPNGSLSTAEPRTDIVYMPLTDKVETYYDLASWTALQNLIDRLKIPTKQLICGATFPDSDNETIRFWFIEGPTNKQIDIPTPEFTGKLAEKLAKLFRLRKELEILPPDVSSEQVDWHVTEIFRVYLSLGNTGKLGSSPILALLA